MLPRRVLGYVPSKAHEVKESTMSNATATGSGTKDGPWVLKTPPFGSGGRGSVG